jgi:competence protein ComEA
VYQRLIEQLRWFGLRRVVTGAFAVLVVAVGAWWIVRVPPVPVESRISFTGTSIAQNWASSLNDERATPLGIVVHVAGEVKSPGVYTLPNGARMVDAVTAAGGATARADLEVINLATPLIDSSQIYVPAKGVAARPNFARPQPGVNGVAAAPNAPSASGVVNINRASVSELDALPGVGPSTAQAIVDYRMANGPFGSPEDLLNVKGIGPAKFDAMRKLVEV